MAGNGRRRAESQRKADRALAKAYRQQKKKARAAARKAAREA